MALFTGFLPRKESMQNMFAQAASAGAGGSNGPFQMSQITGGEGNDYVDIYNRYAPIANAGLGQIPALSQGASAGGYNERIGEILGMAPVQNQIAEQQRGLKTALGAQGMRRSGYGVKSAAAIPQQVAQSVEGLLTNRSQSLFGVGQGALGEQNQALTAMLNEMDAKKQASANRSAGRRSQNMGLAGMAIAALAMFSDERLKKNIKEVGTHKGIPVIEWEWNDDAGRKKGLTGKARGFRAQDVQKKYPEAVKEGPDGYLMVDYARLK